MSKNRFIWKPNTYLS